MQIGYLSESKCHFPFHEYAKHGTRANSESASLGTMNWTTSAVRWKAGSLPQRGLLEYSYLSQLEPVRNRFVGYGQDDTVLTVKSGD